VVGEEVSALVDGFLGLPQAEVRFKVLVLLLVLRDILFEVELVQRFHG